MVRVEVGSLLQSWQDPRGKAVPTLSVDVPLLVSTQVYSWETTGCKALDKDREKQKQFREPASQRPSVA